MTYWNIAIALGIGTFSGTFVRLPLFTVFSVLYAGVCVVTIRPLSQAIVSTTLLIGVLELGYVIGLGLRAAVVAALHGNAAGKRMAARLAVHRTRRRRVSN